MNNYHNFLFQKSLQEKVNEYELDKYSDNSLIFNVLWNIFLNQCKLSEEKIYLRNFITNILEKNTYDLKIINISKLKDKISEYLIMFNERIWGIKHEMLEILNKIKTLRKSYNHLCNHKNNKSLDWNKMKKDIEIINFNDAFDLYLNFLIDRNFPLNVSFEKIFFTLNNWEQINQKIIEFKSKYVNNEREFNSNSEITNALLKSLDIYNLKDLTKCSNEFLAFTFETNIDELLPEEAFFWQYYEEMTDEPIENNINIDDLKNNQNFNYYDTNFIFEESKKVDECELDKYLDNSLIFNILSNIFLKLSEEKIYLKNFITNILEKNTYDLKIINISKLKDKISEYLIMFNERVLGIKFEIVKILNIIKTLEKSFAMFCETRDEKENIDWFKFKTNIENLNFNDAFDLYLNFLIDRNFPLNVSFEKIFFTLNNWKKIKEAIDVFKSKFNNNEREFNFNSEITNALLKSLDIYNLKDLTKCSNEFLAFIFGTNIDELLPEEAFFQKYYEEITNKLAENNIDIDDLKDDNNDIYALKKLKKYKYEEIILNKVFKNREFSKWIYFSELNKIFENEQFWIFIKKMTTRHSNNKYFFNKKYCFFYNNEVFDIEKIIAELPNVITNKDFDNFNALEKQIITSKYKKNGTTYLKTGYSLNDLIVKEIRENFPYGYKINQINVSNDNKKLIKILFDKYGINYENRIDSFLERKELILIDRGLYLHFDDVKQQQKDCINVNEKQIIDFIEEEINEKSFVFYRAIFNYFIVVFKNNNIKNHYFAKGLIDKIIISKYDQYKNTKDKITKKYFEENVNAKILECIEEIKGVFGMNDLLKKFNGKKSYFFTQAFNSYKDKIIKLKKETFISSKFLDIQEECKNDVLENLFNLIQNSDIGIVSDQKLFNNFLENYKFSYDKLEDYLKDEFSFFSLTNYLFLNQSNFQDTFAFHRPYIWNKNLYQKMNKEVLLEVFINLINKDVIKADELSYLFNKYEFTFTLPYNDKMKNSNYVRINRSEYLKTELFEFYDEEIKTIHNMINEYLECNEQSNEQSISLIDIDYSLFEAHYDFEWNKYSLTSFIEKYLSNFFEVENESIRKVNN
ncbi:hypothetical protein [Metamycoplasma equirhinis]|uniref:hypothetical protein n=1 Tax=Metamycoplasma equirhinis TaxID=92402 RepID=UPI00359C5147